MLEGVQIAAQEPSDLLNVLQQVPGVAVARSGGAGVQASVFLRGGVSNFDPSVKKDGTLLSEGYITIQGESHPTEFRKIEVLNLSGCMDPRASNYKSYHVHRQDDQCNR